MHVSIQNNCPQILDIKKDVQMHLRCHTGPTGIPGMRDSKGSTNNSGERLLPGLWTNSPSQFSIRTGRWLCCLCYLSEGQFKNIEMLTCSLLLKLQKSIFNQNRYPDPLLLRLLFDFSLSKDQDSELPWAHLALTDRFIDNITVTASLETADCFLREYEYLQWSLSLWF